MNLIAAVSILLVTILTFQTTVINGAKSLAEHKQHSSSSKEHLALESPAASDGGDSLVRKGRGAKSSNQGSEAGGGGGAGGGGVGKRGKNSKKLNKSTHLENSNAPATSAQSMSSDIISEERTKSPQHEQKSTSSASSLGHQHNNKPKQKQMLKAQQHQTHVKRGGGNAKSVGEKKSEEQKLSSCRYSKSAWTECDTKTNSRSRTLTLKKGESSCQQSRTIQKKCKKACRYEKGAWTECTSGQMTRQDKLKTTSDATCEPVRAINKKCNPGGGKPKDKGNKERKNKDKNSRKAAAA